MGPVDPERPLSVQGRDLPLAAQVHRRPLDPRRAGRPQGAVRQPGARRARAAARSPTSTTTTTATSTTRPTARRAAPRRSSSRSAPGWSSSSSRRSARPRSASRRSGTSAGRSRRGAAEPAIELLGNLDAERLSIVSFVLRSPSGRYLHHNYVVALLNDLFGIQSRGGCSCAGPYGHRLLGIDLERSHEFEREITGGCEGIKPGWVRINFNYFVSDAVADYLIEAVRLVARDGWRLLERLPLRPGDRALAAPRRRGRPAAEPAATSPTPTARWSDPPAGRPGERSCSPSSCAREPRSSPPRPSPDLEQHPAQVSADFEHLRWFDLPSACLEA